MLAKNNVDTVLCGFRGLRI